MIIRTPTVVSVLILTALLLHAAPTCLAQDDASKLKEEVLALTGGRRAKIVWARIPPGGSRVEFVSGYWLKDKATKEKLAISIVGFDTNEGVERVIVEAPTGCNTPLITYDGSKVIYTDFSENTCYVVNWDGTGKRVLGTGKYRFAAAYWRDPSNGTEWVYYNLHYIQTGGHDGQMAVCDPSAVWTKKGDPCIVRRRLDGKGDYETVWDQSNCWYEFSLSADGTRAGGAFETWPNCQVANLKTGELEKYGIGCVPNFAPDDSGRFFYFVGSHASIEFLEAGKKNLRTIPLNFPKNGMRGNEAWPIRWSTDVRFVSVSGPWAQHTNWAPANVQLGRFNADFTAFEAWVTLTNTPDFLDAEPYMWVAPAPAQAPVNTAAPDTHSPAPVTPPAVATTKTDTPTEAGTLFNWPHGNWKETPAIAFDPDGKQIKDYMLTEQGYAHLGRRYQMVIRHGAFLAPGAAKYATAQVNASGNFGLAMMLTPDRSETPGLRQVFSLGDAGKKCFVIEQDKDSLRITYRTKDGKAVPIRVRLSGSSPMHLAVSAVPGEVVAFVDGKKAASLPVRDAQKAARQAGDWSGDAIVFGHGTEVTQPWQGEIESIVLTSRPIDASEAVKLCDAARARIAAQKEVPRVRVRARLTQRSEIIKPEVMTYSRGLALYEYEVQQVIEGQYTEKKIYVYHWVLMDKHLLPIVQRPIGEVCDLVLEPFEDHPQLQRDCQSNTLEGEDIELNHTLYLDIGS